MRDTEIDYTDGSELTVGEVADVLGVTARTLRHWDSIGLLVPSWRTAAGHRLYLDADIERAQQILVYREIGVPLDEVKTLVDGATNPRDHLIRQRHLLKERASHLHRMIDVVDNLLEAIDMDKKMTARDAAEKFGGGWRQDWADEAEQRWGDSDEFAESARRNANRTKDEWAQMYADQDALVAALAEAVRAGTNPDSEQGREISAKHRAGIEKHYECGHARQVCLARMYLADSRFREAYESEDKGGVPGAVEWLVAAIEADARAHGVNPDTATW